MSFLKMSKDSPNSGKKIMRKLQEETEKQTKSGFPQRINPSNINNSKMIGSPKSSRQGKDPNEQQHHKKIEAQKDYFSGNLNSFENLEQYMDHYVCPCTKCHPNGFKDIIQTDQCFREFVTSLNSLVSLNNDKAIELDLIKKEIMSQPQPQSFEEGRDPKLNFLRETISNLERKLFSQFNISTLNEGPIELPNTINEQHRCKACDNMFKDFSSKLMQFYIFQRESDEGLKENTFNCEKTQGNAQREGQKQNYQCIQGDPTEIINIGIDNEEALNKSADLQNHEKIDSVNQENIKNIDLKQTQTDQKPQPILKKKSEEELPKIQEQLSRSQKKIQEFEGEMSIMKEQQGNYLVSLAEKEKQISAYKDQQSQWKRQLADKQELISSINKEKLQLQSSLSKQKKNYAELEKNYRDLEEQRAVWIQQIQLNDSILSERSNESKILQDQFKQQEMEQSLILTSFQLQLDSSKSEMKQQAEDHSKKIAQLQQQKQELLHQLKGKEEVIPSLEAKVKQLEEKSKEEQLQWQKQRERLLKQIESLELFKKKVEVNINGKYQNINQQFQIAFQQTNAMFELKSKHCKELQDCEQKHKQQMSNLTQLKTQQIQETQKTHNLEIRKLKDRHMYQLTAQRDRNIQNQQIIQKVVSQLTENNQKIAQIQNQKLKLQQQLKGKEQTITNLQIVMKGLRELYEQDKFEWSDQREKMGKQILQLKSLNKKLEEDSNAKHRSLEKVKSVLQQTKKQLSERLNEEKMKHFKEQADCQQKHKLQIVRLTELKAQQISETQKTHFLEIKNLKDQHWIELTTECNRNTELQQENLRVESQIAEHTQRIAQILHQNLQLQDQLKVKEQIITNRQTAVKDLRILYSKDKLEWSQQMANQKESFESFNKKLEEGFNAQYLSFNQQIKAVLQQTKTEFEQKLTEEKLKHFKELQECQQKHKQHIVRLTQLKTQQIQETKNSHSQEIRKLKDGHMQELTAEKITNTELQQENQRVASQLAALSNSYLRNYTQQTDLLSQRTKIFDDFLGLNEQTRLADQQEQRQNCETLLSTVTAFRQQKEYLEKQLAKAVSYSTRYEVGNKVLLRDKQDLQSTIVSYQNEAKKLREDHQKEIDRLNSEASALDELWTQRCNSLSACQDTSYKAILESERSVLTAQIDTLKTQVQQLEDASQFKADLSKVEDILNQKQIEDLKNTIRIDGEEHEKQVTKLKAQLRDQKLRLQLALKEQNRKLLVLINDEKKKVKENAKLLDQYLIENLHMQQQNNILREKVKEYEKELIQLKKQNAEMEKKNIIKQKTNVSEE